MLLITNTAANVNIVCSFHPESVFPLQKVFLTVTHVCKQAATSMLAHNGFESGGNIRLLHYSALPNNVPFQATFHFEFFMKSFYSSHLKNY